MIDLTIDPILSTVLNPLPKESFEQLEASILERRMPVQILVWEHNGKRLIVDGHHRHKICKKHGIEFDAVWMEFNDRSEVIEWIERNQIARRNLSKVEFDLLIGKIFNERKQSHGGDKKSKRQIDALIKDGGKTAGTLAEEVGMSPRTVERLGQRAEVVDSLLEAGQTEAAEAAKTAPQDAIAEASTEIKAGDVEEAAEAVKSPKRRPLKPNPALVKPKPVPEPVPTAEGFLGVSVDAFASTLAMIENSQLTVEQSVELAKALLANAKNEKAKSDIGEGIFANVLGLLSKAARQRVFKDCNIQDRPEPKPAKWNAHNCKVPEWISGNEAVKEAWHTAIKRKKTYFMDEESVNDRLKELEPYKASPTELVARLGRFKASPIAFGDGPKHQRVDPGLRSQKQDKGTV